jgi:hypothetical protein
MDKAIPDHKKHIDNRSIRLPDQTTPYFAQSELTSKQTLTSTNRCGGSLRPSHKSVNASRGTLVQVGIPVTQAVGHSAQEDPGKYGRHIGCREVWEQHTEKLQSNGLAFVRAVH